MRRKKAALNIAVLAVSLALVAYLFSLVDIADFIKVMASVRPEYLLPAFVFYASSSVFRAFRFRVFLGRHLGVRKLFSITIVHNLFNQFMPARSGELSLIIMLRREGTGTGRGIAVLVVTRVLDFLALCALFCIAALWLGSAVPWLLSGMVAVIALVALLCAALVLLMFRGRLFLSLADRILKATGLAGYRPVSYLFRKMVETVDAFGGISLRRTLPASAGLTAMIWSFIFLSNLILVEAFGLRIGAGQAVALVFVMMSLPLLPVYGAGGFGTTEAAMTVVLMAYGISQAVAVPASFGMHVVILMFVVVMGLLGLATLGKSGARLERH